MTVWFKFQLLSRMEVFEVYTALICNHTHMVH